MNHCTLNAALTPLSQPQPPPPLPFPASDPLISREKSLPAPGSQVSYMTKIIYSRVGQVIVNIIISEEFFKKHCECVLIFFASKQLTAFQKATSSLAWENSRPFSLPGRVAGAEEGQLCSHASLSLFFSIHSAYEKFGNSNRHFWSDKMHPGSLESSLVRPRRR